MVWIEAIKRLACTYLTVSGGTVAAVLSERIRDTAAKVVITSDSMCRLSGTMDQIPERDEPADPHVIVEQLEVEFSTNALYPGWFDAPVLLERALERLLARQATAHKAAVQDQLWICALWRLSSPRPVEASHPLFVLSTSGSQGNRRSCTHMEVIRLGSATADEVFDLRPLSDPSVTVRSAVVRIPCW